MKYVIGLLLLLITTQALAAANITVRLSHNPVSLDESFHLIYETDTSVDDDPDFTALEKDFEILSSSLSTNMRSVNGKWSLKKSWDLTLISKDAGIFTIPSIPFGRDLSPAVRVTVKPAGTYEAPGGDSSLKPFFIEVYVDKKQAWVQSEIIYTIRFFTNVHISRPTLSEPETSDPDARIEKLGEVSNYQKLINGVRYSVSELRFAVYPQHSGTLTFKPVLFEGRVSKGRTNSLFDQFMKSGTLKRVRSKGISIKIKPRPSNIAVDEWLPAESVSLQEDWSEDISQLKTGEPVTRTITVIAKGQPAEQLPELGMNAVDGLKQYPDKPLSENDAKRDGITGTREIKIAMIPTQAGRYIIPEVVIPWWNTRTGQQQLARLPQLELEAVGLADTSPLQPPVLQPDTATPAQQPSPKTIVREITSAGYWPWLSLALAIGWVTTTVLYFNKRRHPEQQPQKIKPDFTGLESAVGSACTRADAEAAKDALLAWAAARWPERPVNNLSELARRSSTELGEQVRALNSHLYSSSAASWNRNALLKAFKVFTSAKETTHREKATPLEPLYKT